MDSVHEIIPWTSGQEDRPNDPVCMRGLVGLQGEMVKGTSRVDSWPQSSRLFFSELRDKRQALASGEKSSGAPDRKAEVPGEATADLGL